MADLEQDLNFDGETTIEDGVKVKSFKILQATCNVMPFGRFHLIWKRNVAFRKEDLYLNNNGLEANILQWILGP